MIEIEYKESLDEKYYKIIDDEFNKYAVQKGVECNYKPYNFIAKENDKIVGIITGHTYYKEVHIGDLIVLEEYRNKNIGRKLMETVENYFKIESQNCRDEIYFALDDKLPIFFKSSSTRIL